MTHGVPSGIDSPRFRAWLDDVSWIDRSKEPPSHGCDRCGTATGTQPFFGEYCLFCAAYAFGRYDKSQELALFVKLIMQTAQDSNLIDLTQEIEAINWDCVLPLANSEEATRGGRYRWE